MLIARLDEKLKFLDLANVLAHANTVLLQTTMGAVAVTEQAIINETHKRGMVVPNRPYREPHSTGAAVGAYVANPKKGLHDFVGAIDINSLYPSIIRAMNMGPETIVGQIKQDATTELINERIKDIDCVYEEKYKLSDIANMIKEKYSQDLQVIIGNPSGQEYVGDSRQLQNINIFMKDKLAGLEKGLEAMNGKN